MFPLLIPYPSFTNPLLLFLFLSAGFVAFFWFKNAHFIRNTSVTKGNTTVTKRNTCVTEASRSVTLTSENVTFTHLKPLIYKAVTFRYVFSTKSALFGVHFLRFGYHFLFSPLLYLIAIYKNASIFTLIAFFKTPYLPKI